MAAIVTHVDHPQPHGRAEWTPQVALRYSWYVYLTLLVLPLLLFLYVVWSINRGVWTGDAGASGGATGNQWLADRWFLGTVAYMVLVVPASFFLRSRFFQGYWSGDCVSPRNYFRGSLVTWLALEVGGLLSLVGCLMTRSLTPCIIPALVAFMAFVVLWPNGRAMISRGRGASDDPEKYEEPR